MQQSEVIDALAGLEQRFAVHTWQVDGVPLWPQLRTDLGTQLILSSEQPSARARTLAGGLRELIGKRRTLPALVRDARHTLLQLAPADVLTLSYPTSRVWLGEAYVDRFFDPIADVVESAGGRLLQLESRRPGTDYRVPRHRPSAWIRPLVQGEVLMGAAAHWAPRDALPGYDDLCEQLRGLSARFTPPRAQDVLRHAHQVLRLAKLFERILVRVKPKLVLISCYYNPVGWALCLAARRSGVLSADMQHGVVARNPAYEGWSRFPPGGYPTLPDLFWCWSEADTRPMNGWPEHARIHHRAFVGGQPWAAYCEEGPGLAPLRDQLRDRRGPGLNVLVSLSNGGMTEAILEVMRAAPSDWRFWLRLHPTAHALRTRTREQCEAQVPGRYLLDEGTDLPLPLLVRDLDVHLTLNSTVLQEAMAYGMPTVLLDSQVVDIFDRELASGWAVLAAGAAQVVAALQSQHARRDALPRSAAYPSRAAFVRTVQSLLDDPLAFRAAVVRAPNRGET